MRRLNNGMRFVPAMEDDDENKRVVTAEAGDGTAGAENMETELAEVNEAHAEGEEALAQVDEAEDTAEALEGFAIALKGIAGNGGLDKNGAMILNLTMEHFANRLGIDNGTPSMESFGSASSRARATSVSMEAVNETIKKIWDAIIAQIKKGIEWIKGYYNKVFGGAERLIKRAQALQKKADATTGNQANKKITNDRLVAALQLNNAPPRAAGIVPGAQHLVASAKEIFTVAAVKAGSIGDEAVSAIDSGSADAAEKIGLLITSPPGFTAVGNPDAEGLGNAAEGTEVVRSEVLFGDKAIVIRKPKSGLSGDAALVALSKSSASIMNFNKGVKKSTNNQLDALTNTDAGKLAEVVESLGDELLAYRKNLDKITTAKKKLADAATKAANAGANEEDEGKRATAKVLPKVAAAADRLMTQPAASYAHYVLNTGKALLDLAQLSLAEYKAE